ncbi:MAG: hypothetical protein PHT88_01975 [Candidatus Moranbacteria bacterium]|nr:hypothetical protein [Candidatus Moranbacteria bacterium]
MLVQESSFSEIIALGEDRVGKHLELYAKNYVELVLLRDLKSYEATVNFYAYEHYTHVMLADGYHLLHARLQGLGDWSWLLAGLFPNSRRVQYVGSRYYIDMSIMAYSRLVSIGGMESDVFRLLARQVPLIVAVLASLRDVKKIVEHDIRQAMDDMEVSIDNPMRSVFKKIPVY